MHTKQDKIILTIMIVCGLLIGATVIAIGPTKIVEAMVNQSNLQMEAMKMREKELIVNRDKLIENKEDNPSWLKDSIYNIELAIRNQELKNLNRGIAQSTKLSSNNLSD